MNQAYGLRFEKGTALLGVVGRGSFCNQPRVDLTSEYARPWKLVTLAIGLALLVLGSFHYQALDWDIPISFIMGVLAYFAAPWSMRVLVERRWRLWPAMLFATWFTVDGSYWLYWALQEPGRAGDDEGGEFLRLAVALRNAAFCGSTVGAFWTYPRA